MTKVKHVPDASKRIDLYFNEAPPFAKPICEKLRGIVHKADPSIIEDWKWGPNFYHDGMVCWIAHFKKHVTFTFFQGAQMKDPKKILQCNEGNLHNRHIKYTDVKEINENMLVAYVKEAVKINQKGEKLLQAKDKTVIIPDLLKKELSKQKLLKDFESRTYYWRKEHVQWLESAKREETKTARLNKLIHFLKTGSGMNDKYIKK